MNELLLPLGQVAAIGGAVALGPLIWWRQRSRASTPAGRLRALTLLTLFLTFDLIVFGAFTRLTDSGLGCPDWPGCYSAASPVGAHEHIEAAQMAMPAGPVTHGKAWIEMVHRYLASGVGLLILVMTVLSWRLRRHDGEAAPSPWLPTLTLVWVCVQGAFGALTVTMKLFPAIVTLHLLFGLGLLMLLAWQREAYEPRPISAPGALCAAVIVVLLLALAQVALGGWVSTNYAVLACDEFPSCHGGQWWPQLDFAQGFQLGASSASAPAAAISASRRWPPSTWPTAWVRASSSQASWRWPGRCAIPHRHGHAGCSPPPAGSSAPACPMSCSTGPSSRPWATLPAPPCCWPCSPPCSRA